MYSSICVYSYITEIIFTLIIMCYYIIKIHDSPDKVTYLRYKKEHNVVLGVMCILLIITLITGIILSINNL